MALINQQYFSGTQASLFIGDVWVDDIANYEYVVQHDRSPIYGYGSQHFDFVPKGSILVSGSFTVNFREPNYLWLILDRYRVLNSSGETRLQEQKSLAAATKAQTYEGDKRKRLEEFFNKPSPTDARDSLIEQSREFNDIAEDETEVENFNHTSFDMLIGYGSKLGPDSPGETIKAIQIMGKGKTIQLDGRPIQETYQFIARKID